MGLSSVFLAGFPTLCVAQGMRPIYGGIMVTAPLYCRLLFPQSSTLLATRGVSLLPEIAQCRVLFRGHLLCAALEPVPLLA